MSVKHLVSVLLVIVMTTSVLVPAVSTAASNEDTMPLSAALQDEVPDTVSVSISTNSVDFGVLRPGEVSNPVTATITNDGSSAVTLAATVEDDGDEPIFSNGISINDNDWRDYHADLGKEEQTDIDIVLRIAEDITSRGEVGGSMIIWVEESPLPNADFSADVTSGPSPLTVQFTDLSTNSPTSWAWDFNNDGTVDSTEQNPTYTYEDTGLYAVNLTVTNEVGSDIEIKTGYILVWPVDLYSGSVVLIKGETSTFTASNSPHNERSVDQATDAGALIATGLDFKASDQSYATYGSFFLEEIDGIANDAQAHTSWFILVDDTMTDVGFGANVLEDGMNIKFVYCPYDDEFNALLDQVWYVINIDVEVKNYGTLLSSTFLGGNAVEECMSSYQALAIDSDGSVYVVGTTMSSNLATEGAYGTSYNASYDVFVAKFSADMSTLLACTYFGGSGNDFGTGIVIGTDGSVYISGDTTSDGLPMTGYQTEPGGARDAFIAKFSSDLSVLQAFTYLGGNYNDAGVSLVLANDDSVYVVGYTWGSSGLATEGAYDTSVSSRDAFIAKFSSDLSVLQACTYFGGSNIDYGYSIALDTDGNVYISGYTMSDDLFETGRGGNNDAFIAKFDPSLSHLIAGKYFGGSASDMGYGLAVASDGSVYLTGNTVSNDLFTLNPSVTGNQTTYGGSAMGMMGYGDVFVAKFDASLALQACTYFGGDKDEVGYAITVGSDGTVYVAGFNNGGNIPLKDAYQPTYGTMYDGFIAVFSSDLLQLKYSTYLGVEGQDQINSIALNADGNLIVLGKTAGSAFPALNAYDDSYNGGTSDLFVAVFLFGDYVRSEPVARFSADVTSGGLPLTVQFTDESIFEPTSWAWDINNDGTVDSTEQNPSWTYSEAGTYTVTLTVTNAAGSDTVTKTDYVTVS